ncbi:hypothetical protein ATER59S_02461 [Aquamicrobium terrae]
MIAVSPALLAVTDEYMKGERAGGLAKRANG